VLVVDDEADVRLLLRHALRRRRDVEVVGEAADGNEAVELAATLGPDVIVLDQMMPEMSGTDALPYLRQAAASAYIVFHSSLSATALDKALGTRDGADSYVPKGHTAELLALIDRLRAGARR